MVQRAVLTALVLVLIGGAGASRASDPAGLGAGCDSAPSSCLHLESTIALTSTRDNPAATPAQLAAEIYLVNPDGTEPRRLTDNADGDGFPALSPDGKKIVFDSNRDRTATEPLNTSDLFLMKTDGREQTFLVRGSSASWSSDNKSIAFHASASGTGVPIKPDVGAATSDSDIFVARIGDLLEGLAAATNVTNTPGEIEDDADWSPDGQRLVFTSHPAADDPQFSNQGEIYVMNAEGTGRVQLTDNDYEERAPSWSPDGSRIVFSCRIAGGTTDFEICVMDADGTNVVQLTDNAAQDLTGTWSRDGTRLAFHRIPPFELWVMDPDGTDQTQLTNTPGVNGLAQWGEVWAPDAR
jgi:TolB protein